MTSHVTGMFFPLEVTWVDQGVQYSGTIYSKEDGYWLQSDREWSVSTAQDSRTIPQTEVRAKSSSGPVYAKGIVYLREGYGLLKLEDLRIGTDSAEEMFVRAFAIFEHADRVVTYYHRDGAARSYLERLNLPTLGDAPSMFLLYAPERIELISETPTTLEHFETHLDAFQRLLAFAAQHSAARLSLKVETQGGTQVNVFGRTMVKPKSFGNIDHRNFPVRLGAASTDQIIYRWWGMMENLRPIPQIISSILAQPGYLESDFLLFATAIERLSDAWTKEPGLL
ncbi:MAG: hypothetical protein WBA28_01055, partial [Microbacteriaceae bacterium]